MASTRRKSYRGTPEQHASDASYYTKDLRWQAKSTILQAKAGNCGAALERFQRLAQTAGIATVSKAYALTRVGRGTERLVTRPAVRNAVSRAREAVAVCYEGVHYRKRK